MRPEAVDEERPHAAAGWRSRATIPALRHRNFRLFAVGQGISLVGFWMQSAAQGWLVARLSSSALALGIVACAGYLPILCVASVAGVIADRLPRYRVLLATQALLMAITLALAVLVATGVVTVPMIVGAAFLIGLVSALDVPTRQSFLVEMVGPADLGSAIALNSSLFNGARVIGPACAGLLVHVVGEGPCFMLNAASYGAAILALLRMDAGAARVAPRQATEDENYRDGLRYVRARPALRNLLVLLGVVSGLAIQYSILMPVFAPRVLGTDARGFGLLLSATGIGAVLSGITLAVGTTTRARHRRNLLLGLVAFGGGVVGLSLTRSFGLALGLQALAGYGMIRYTATTNTMLQLMVDDRYRGRVMGLHTVMFLGTAPVGALLLTATADRTSIPAAVMLSGSVALGAAVWVAIRLRRTAVRE